MKKLITNIWLLVSVILIIGLAQSKKCRRPMGGKNTCLVSGVHEHKCKGYCPPCWIRDPDKKHWQCYEYVPGTKNCPSWPRIIHVGGDKPEQTWNYFKDKTCYVSGEKKNPKAATDPSAPPCWGVNFFDQTFSCFQYMPGTSNVCPPGDGMTDVGKLSSH